MTYEVQLQLGSVQYTVRGPETDGVLSLIERLQAIGRPDPISARSLADLFAKRKGREVRADAQVHEDFEVAMGGDTDPVPVSSPECRDAAEATLKRMGYTWNGGVLWRPPIGKAPVFEETPLPKIEDPHADLRATWAPGQHWQARTRGNPEWISIAGTPFWHADQEYRRAPEDGWIDWAGTTSPVRAHAKVQVKLTNGYESGIVPAHTVEWNSKSGSHFAIVAYRVVKP